MLDSQTFWIILGFLLLIQLAYLISFFVLGAKRAKKHEEETSGKEDR